MYHLSMEQFMEQLASKAPVPGGGGAAALCGSMAAALGSMVAHLTIGKKAYKEVEDQVIETEKQLAGLRKTFLELVNRDAAAFEPLSAAYRLPRDTDTQRQRRREVMEAGLYEASVVPMEMMEKTEELLELLDIMEQNGSKLAVSDVGVAVQLARSALFSASMNVWINTGMMEDRERAVWMEQRADRMLESGIKKADRIFERVTEKIRRNEG